MHLDKTGINQTGTGSMEMQGRLRDLDNTDKNNTKDTFQLTPQTDISSLSRSEIASLAFSFKGIQKQHFDFKLKDHAQAPDGTIYSAYSDPQQDKGNYISAFSPDGTVKWDVQVGDNSLYSIKADADGTVYARTKNSLVSIDSSGQKKFEHKFTTKVRDHWIDQEGNNFFRQSFGSNIYIVDKSGNYVETPGHLKERSLSNLKMNADGIIWGQGSNSNPEALFGKSTRGVARFEMDENSEVEFFEIKEPHGCNREEIWDIHPTKDGGLMVKSKLVKSVSPTKNMFGFAGSGVPTYAFGDSSVIREWSVTRLDSDGKEQWRNKNLGQKTKMDITSDDNVLFTTNEPNRRKQFEINKLNDRGRQKKFAVVNDPVSDFKIRPNDQHLFVKTENNDVFEFDRGGKQVRTARLDKGSDMEFADFSSDGRILLVDRENETLNIWNPSDNTQKQITNHSMDYSFKTEINKPDTEKEIQENSQDNVQDNTENVSESNRKAVQVKNDSVVINGVKIKKKNSGLKYR
jgi:hypothetical protein